MLYMLVAGVAYAVDLILSFMTDGCWKTAGSGLVYLYWNRNSAPVASYADADLKPSVAITMLLSHVGPR
jgi:hypothetical protein